MGDIEVVKVANGWMVTPQRSINRDYIFSYSEVHVFTELPALQKYIGDHFGGAPEEIGKVSQVDPMELARKMSAGR